MHRSAYRLANKMFILGEREVKQALCFKECLKINREALITITEKTSYVPSRLGLPYPNHPDTPSLADGAQDWTLIKPAAHYSDEYIAMGLKVISLRSNNPSNGLPLAPATILLIDAASGVVKATMAGTDITVARTSAGSALAVQVFRPDVQHLVVFGAGAQASCHIDMMEVALERTIPKITIVNRSRERAEELRQRLLKRVGDEEIEVLLLSDERGITAALATADVVSATTNATTPLFQDGTILKEGCLVTGIGSYTPEMQEIPPSAVNRCHVIIDTPEAMQVGDLKHLGSLEDSNHPITMAGNALQNPSDIGKTKSCIFYKAVGTAVQDVLVADGVMKKAKSLRLGQEIDMD